MDPAVFGDGTGHGRFPAAKAKVCHPQRGFIERLLAAFPEHGKTNGAIARRTPPETLTDRDRSVAVVGATKPSNQEIAAELIVSVATVRRHTHNIYQKLHVNKRRDAVAKAREIGQLPGLNPIRTPLCLIAAQSDRLYQAISV
ncbi:MAG: LuxR C-terminal-related transcriptional regulator [Caldilineaceae bacterium]